MCIPPAEDPPSPHFALLATIARRNGLKALSMGMSADFEAAIQLGATHVRVGSAIFGREGLATQPTISIRGARSDRVQEPPDHPPLDRDAAGGRLEARPGEVQEDRAAAAAHDGPRFQAMSRTTS